MLHFGFAYLLIDSIGTILSANEAFINIVKDVTSQNRIIKLGDIKGKKLTEVFGSKYYHTVVGAFMKDKKTFSRKFLIGRKKYQVMVKKVNQDGDTCYELYYIPAQITDHLSSESLKERIFQKIAYDMAYKKGFSDIEWIKSLSDKHCQQLIYCLDRHDHIVIPSDCCPYEQQCGFNPNYGWIKLERRAFYRVPVDLEGKLYLQALPNKYIPPALTMKKVICKALDLSVAGIRLQLKVNLPTNSYIKLIFDDFTCQGTIVWVKKSDKGWFAGVEFNSLGEEQYDNIIKVYIRAQCRKI